ncbi:MAG: hypothetical protein EOO77_29440 [Oxalobacteraceae bacterium]|nr:MAG: hypothetical protein EOO77_29440 [Oxalobacteraceae bacterium]
MITSGAATPIDDNAAEHLVAAYDDAAAPNPEAKGTGIDDESGNRKPDALRSDTERPGLAK